MVVVAILMLMAAVVVPGWVRARKRAQATRILEDLRILDGALDKWAIETQRTAGDPALFDDLKPYIKKNTELYNTGADAFGLQYGPFVVDQAPKVLDATYEALSDVAPPEFWSPYH